MTCLGVDNRAFTPCETIVAPISLCEIRAQRAAIQDLHRVQRADAYTHENGVGHRFLFTAEQAQREHKLYCMEFLITHDAEPLVQRQETQECKQQRIDEAVVAFLSSSRVLHEAGARVSHADFANALRQEMHLNASQHAISAACKRAKLENHSSHKARFWMNLKLT